MGIKFPVYDIEGGLFHGSTGCELQYLCFTGDWNLKAPENEEEPVMLFHRRSMDKFLCKGAALIPGINCHYLDHC